MAGSFQKNNGMRIDHFLITDNLIEDIKTIKINKNLDQNQNLLIILQ